jgi:hypothetical protein
MGACMDSRSANESLVHEFWIDMYFRRNNSSEFLEKARLALQDYNNPDKNLIRQQFKTSNLDEQTCQEMYLSLQRLHQRHLFLYFFFLLKVDERTKENFVELIKLISLNVGFFNGDRVRKIQLYDIFYGYVTCITRECIDRISGMKQDDINLKEVYSKANIKILAERKMPKEDITIERFWEEIFCYLNNDVKIRDDLFVLYEEQLQTKKKTNMK